MRKLSFAFALLISFSSYSQNSISGSFSPAKDYSWLIAYRLKPGTQVYAADTAIENGEFEMEFPKETPKGTYRLVYSVPQEEFYFDVLYDGKEDIELTFNTAQGVKFMASEENILFGTYFREMNAIEHEMIAFYSKGLKNKKAFTALLEKFSTLQETYEKKSEGLIAHQFIKANRPYLPTEYLPFNDYVQNRKEAYFKNLDLTNPILQASGFLSDKLANYVFTALPVQPLEKSETEKQIQANIATVYEKLNSVSDAYNFHILYSLWAQSSGSGYTSTADFLYSKYLKSFKADATNKEIIDQIEIHNRLRIGAVAPELVWQKGDEQRTLSTVQGHKNYVLVFWSSTCGHCLKELPALHKEIKANNHVKVIAVGLEDDDTSWTEESAKLDSFEHLIALGKWESDYAQLYDIHATPTYFILDQNKKIVSKPESDREVVSFLREN